MTTGYNGTGNGVNGRVNVAANFQNGDLYIGGRFTQAGGYSQTGYFSCYRITYGWSGASGVYAQYEVTGFSWTGAYELKLQGTFLYVYGPTSSGGPYVTTSTPNGVAYWKEWHYGFLYDYWDTGGT